MLLKFARARLATPPIQAPGLLALLGRILLPELPSPPVSAIDLRQFAEANLQARSFSGAMVGRWMVDATSERVEPELRPVPKNQPRTTIETVRWTIVIHFAYTRDRELCVIEVVEKSGWTERSVYQVITDIDGEILGPMIGVPCMFKQKRVRSDLCLPEGWMPSRRDGESEK